jgi:hypothetical protein
MSLFVSARPREEAPSTRLFSLSTHPISSLVIQNCQLEAHAWLIKTSSLPHLKNASPGNVVGQGKEWVRTLFSGTLQKCPDDGDKLCCTHLIW